MFYWIIFYLLRCVIFSCKWFYLSDRGKFYQIFFTFPGKVRGTTVWIRNSTERSRYWPQAMGGATRKLSNMLGSETIPQRRSSKLFQEIQIIQMMIVAIWTYYLFLNVTSCDDIHNVNFFLKIGHLIGIYISGNVIYADVPPIHGLKWSC